MYSQIIKEGFLNLETVPEAKQLTNRGTFHKRLTLMILHRMRPLTHLSTACWRPAASKSGLPTIAWSMPIFLGELGLRPSRWMSRPASSKGQHGLRAVARLQCLRQASETRFDYEGLLDSDIHAFSSASFVRWRNSLSSFQSLLLRICRGGAVFTPTRRYQENSGPCPFCKAPVPSMRHFWADCQIPKRACEYHA